MVFMGYWPVTSLRGAGAATASSQSLRGRNPDREVRIIWCTKWESQSNRTQGRNGEAEIGRRCKGNQEQVDGQVEAPTMS